MLKVTIEDFIKSESSAGIVLIFVTIAALILKNTDFSPIYNAFLHTPVEVRFGALNIAKPLFLWINDGLMAIFFFLIGLEVKRELLEGHLSSAKQITLPAIAAVGGMLVPALVYVYFNMGDEIAMKGWAIPTATDIAFALGILSLLGSRVPVSLKIFLMALAILDDLGAIVVIALFYTTDLSITSIVVATLALIVLIALNRFKVIKPAAYILVGIILWVSVLKSGVHATLAGVALAFTIPLRSKTKDGKEFSMLKDMEHSLHYWVAFFILPLFAFVNAGVDLRNISPEQLLTNVPMGIMLGLFIGKQLGVFGFSYIAIKLKLATIPEGANFKQLYGVAILTGIGFTMSLFVNSLAFTDDTLFAYTDKLAILIGSFLSGIFGYLILRSTATK
ncbi:Na+/H+ antiporter NhaA [Malaciobacter halophilus]|uniref:Na(+)/H(+) antiporter NhaA n=1 Tax=Malaciobacter halophilus TaxID=197482 RepID=A0A2N1J598_9BACT|nr:Na+/H+ antiporter NhaA [Malaciobacter halophilus]AXH10724.1 sodium:proton antiporter [Malaciobacter halophilus]PKI81747.1 Na+/H+ antiporter NhaA [Malaciobacter halophilus]